MMLLVVMIKMEQKILIIIIIIIMVQFVIKDICSIFINQIYFHFSSANMYFKFIMIVKEGKKIKNVVIMRIKEKMMLNYLELITIMKYFITIIYFFMKNQIIAKLIIVLSCMTNYFTITIIMVNMKMKLNLFIIFQKIIKIIIFQNY